MRKKQPRRVTKEDVNSHYTTLEDAGLPPSICRLVSDMLENDNDSGGLFRNDRSIASFSDAVYDLQQMVDDHNSFLHDSLIFSLEPIIPVKLYGRNDELLQCLEVACAIGQREGESTRMGHSQSAIMVSGFSDCGKSFFVEEVGMQLKKKG